MQRALIPLLILILLTLSLVGLAFYKFADPLEPDSATRPTESGANVAPTELQPNAALEGGAETAARANAQASSAAGGARLALRGTLVAPAGCEDDLREVLAVSRAMDWGALARQLDPRAPRSALEGGELAAALGEGDEDEEDSQDSETPDRPRSTAIVARTPVAADGSFALELPAGSDKLWIGVAGRYQYLPQCVEVDARRPPESLALETRCGAALRIRLRLPEACPSAAPLEGEVAEHSPSMEGLARGAGDAGVQRRAACAERAFEFHALAAEQPSVFRWRPAGYAACERKFERLPAGRLTEVELPILCGGTLRGRVLDPAGAPLAEAVVRATVPGQWFGFDDRTVRSALTDAQGRFELAAVAPREVSLLADHPSYLESNKQKHSVRDGGVVENLELQLGAGNSISGRLLYGERPAPGITVRVTFDMSQMYGAGAMNALKGGAGHARTDAEGRFAVGGLGKGPFTLRADTHAHVVSGEPAPPPGEHRTHLSVRRDGVAPGTQDLELVLRPDNGLRGRVAADDGAPIAKFTLLAQRQGSGPLGTLGQATKREEFSDAAGLFELRGLIDGNWKLYAFAEGFAQQAPLELALPAASGESAELVLVLPHAARVSGRVLDSSGRTVAGARVRHKTEGANWERQISSLPPPPETRTAADGSYTLAGLPRATVALVADSDEHARSAPVQVDLTTALEQRDVELVLLRGATLTGEVFLDDGQHAAGWMVQVTNPSTYDQELKFTDGEGRFRFEHLDAGARQVVAMPAGAPADDGQGAGGAASDAEATARDMSKFVSNLKMTTVDLVEGQEHHLVIGAPPKDPVEVRGTVTLAGAPYAGAMISFVRRGRKSGDGLFKSATVESDGGYALKLDAPGQYTVSIQRFGASPMQQGLVEYARTVPEAATARLDFELPTGRISGRVRAGGKPVAGARITLLSEGADEAGTLWGGQYNESVTDAQGEFDLTALKPGTYSVLAGGAGLLGGPVAQHGREIQGGLVLAAGTWLKDVDFELKSPGTLMLTVVDANGQPVAGAALFVRNGAGQALDRFSMAVSGADGRYEYAGLSPGRYSASARAEGLASADSPEVEVRAGETTPLRITVGTGTYLLVEVLDAEGAPASASLSVKDENGREVGGLVSLADVMKMFSGQAGGGETQRVGPLPAGKYRVRAQLPDGRSTVKPVTLSGQDERKLTVRF